MDDQETHDALPGQCESHPTASRPTSFLSLELACVEKDSKVEPWDLDWICITMLLYQMLQILNRQIRSSLKRVFDQPTEPGTQIQTRVWHLLCHELNYLIENQKAEKDLVDLSLKRFLDELTGPRKLPGHP